MKDKSTIDLLDMFAAHALSGYSRGGVSHMQREDECHEVAVACYDLAIAMVKVRQEILDTVESEMTVNDEGLLERK
jgi:hypothetical protein